MTDETPSDVPAEEPVPAVPEPPVPPVPPAPDESLTAEVPESVVEPPVAPEPAEAPVPAVPEAAEVPEAPAPPVPPVPEAAPVPDVPSAPPSAPEAQYAPPPPPPAAPYAPPPPPQYAQQPMQPCPKNKVAAGVLGILLGSLGIHKFYLGYTTEGLIMLAVSIVSFGTLSWISAIIGLIEGIIYLTMDDQQWCNTYVYAKKGWF